MKQLFLLLLCLIPGISYAQSAFGDSIASKWYTFRTVNPQQKGGSIFITSDMHSRPQLLKALLEQCDYKTCTSFFYAGDMMNYMQQGGEHPFTSFIDASVDLFASSIPFELVRGNHETRGDLAREFPSFFPKANGKLYGSYLLGDVMVVMLDTGEDKAETHPVYANLTASSTTNRVQRAALTPWSSKDTPVPPGWT